MGAEPWKGWVFTDEPGAQSLVIKDAAEFARFQKRLPSVVPSKKKPAPENPDPLRHAAPVDFRERFLLVVLRGDTISAYPQVRSVEEPAGEVVVTFDLPEPPPEARPFGWGVYLAVPLPRTERSIRFRLKEVPRKEPW